MTMDGSLYYGKHPQSLSQVVMCLPMFCAFLVGLACGAKELEMGASFEGCACAKVHFPDTC